MNCGAQAGDPWCYTATGFRRHQHAVRVRDAQGVPPAAEKPAGSLAGRRPTDKQYLIILAAANGEGCYEVSGYGFHGEAQIRAAMDAMVDDARGWFTRVRETQHGTLFQLTDAGRTAGIRYETWMNGGTP
jgi:hypothetical protein